LAQVCPAAVCAIFRIKWRESTGGEWVDNEACGRALLANIHDVDQRRLGKEPVNLVRTGWRPQPQVNH